MSIETRLRNTGLQGGGGGGSSDSGGLAGTGGFYVAWSSDPLLSNEKILLSGSSTLVRTDGSSIYVDAITNAGVSSGGLAGTGVYYLGSSANSTWPNWFVLQPGSSVTSHITGSNFYLNAITGLTINHGSLTGLLDDDHTQYALLAGRGGGQVLIGGTTTTDGLTLRATAGVGSAGADMIFQVGNNGATEAMRILNDGSVGIGAVNPEARFHLSGGDMLLDNSQFIYAKNAAGTATQIFGIDTNSDITIGRGNLDSINNNDGRTIIVTGTGKEFRVLNAANTKVNLYVANDTGRMGLGTVTPDGTLHVFVATAGTVTANGSADDLVVENNGNVGMSFLSPNANYQTIAFGDPENSAIGQIWYLHSTNTMAFQTNGAQQVTIDSNGDVGIGTTGPNYNLHVYGASADKKIAAQSGTVINKLQTDIIQGYVGTESNHKLGFLVNNEVKATIDTSGNVGIGATTTTSKFNVGTADQFQVNSSGALVRLNNVVVPVATYSVSNAGTDRTYNAAATTLDEIANVLGTLIADLQSLRLLA